MANRWFDCGGNCPWQFVDQWLGLQVLVRTTADVVLGHHEAQEVAEQLMKAEKELRYAGPASMTKLTKFGNFQCMSNC